jgi:integrase
VLLATGTRVGELSAARKGHLDLTAGTWFLPRTKNGDAHLVHLSPFACRHLQSLIDLSGDSIWLLPGRDPKAAIDSKAISKAVADRQRKVPFKKRTGASEALSLSGGPWTPHDLRRSMATRMRALRISSDVIERCLNHRPSGIVAVYQRDDLIEERREAFALWGSELERISSEAP